MVPTLTGRLASLPGRDHSVGGAAAGPKYGKTESSMKKQFSALWGKLWLFEESHEPRHTLGGGRITVHKTLRFVFIA